VPTFPIIDTHLHVWDPAILRYPWLDPIPLLNRPYVLADYDASRGAVQVEAMVFVQADVALAQSRQETDWVSGLAREDQRLQGIVASAPLENGDAARPDLEHLARNPLVKGVRRMLQSEDVAFCLRPDFLQGVQALPDYGLSFDICINQRQMANTTELVQRCPRVAFVLDHIGGPDIKHQLMEPWRRELRALAGLPNVWCKVSGLVTEADQRRWEVADLRPYVEEVIAAFGFDRVMFGGDFPVVLQAASLERWVCALDELLAGCSQDELHKLYRDNARAFYRLG